MLTASTPGRACAEQDASKRRGNLFRKMWSGVPAERQRRQVTLQLVLLLLLLILLLLLSGQLCSSWSVPRKVL
jgi:hypothetical protein